MVLILAGIHSKYPHADYYRIKYQWDIYHHIIIFTKVSLHVYRTLIEAGEQYNIRNVGHNALQQLQVVNKCPQWPGILSQKATPIMTEQVTKDHKFKVSSTIQ